MWGLFCILRIALKPDRKYAEGSYQKPPLAHQEEQTTTRILYGTGFEASMAVQLFKTLLNRSPYYHPCKVEHCHCLAIQAGQTNEKAHTGESRLKWEAKTQVNLSEIRTTHYGGYHRRCWDSANQVDYVESKLSAHRCAPLRKSGVARIHQ